MMDELQAQSDNAVQCVVATAMAAEDAWTRKAVTRCNGKWRGSTISGYLSMYGPNG